VNLDDRVQIFLCADSQRKCIFFLVIVYDTKAVEYSYSMRQIGHDHKKPTGISLVMVFSHETELLEQGLDSVLKSKMPCPYEIVLVDNYGTSEARKVAEKLSRAQNNLRILVNTGDNNLSVALNNGVKESRFNLIARLDPDDLVFLDRFNQQWMQFLKYPEICLHFSPVVFINQENMEIGKSDIVSDFRREIRRRNCIMHSSVMFRKDCFELTGGYDPLFKFSQDYDIWLRMLYKHNAVFMSSENPLVYVRKHLRSISNQYALDQQAYALMAKLNILKLGRVVKKNSFVVELLRFYIIVKTVLQSK